MSDATSQDGAVLVNPHLHITHCSSDEILVKHGTRSRFSHILKDDGRTKLLGRLLRNLKEPHSLEELLSTGSIKETERKDAAKLVDYLIEERVLISTREFLPHVYLSMQVGAEAAAAVAEKRVGIVGCGFLGSRLARELARLRVKQLHILDDRKVTASLDRNYFDFSPSGLQDGRSYVATVQSVLEEEGFTSVTAHEGALDDAKELPELLEESDLAIVALEWYSPTVLHAVNEVALALGRPWISTYFDGSIALIGPLFAPGETVCYTEFEIQNEATIGLQDDYMLHKDTLMDGSGDRHHLVLPPFLSVASGWTMASILAFLSTGRTPLAGRCLHVDFERFSVDYQEVLKLPRCPACSPNRPGYRHTFL